MAQEIAPSGLIETWGSTGQILEPNAGKIATGWELGEKPWHEYMNWLHNTFGQKINHLMQYGVPLWNGTTAYLTGAAVQHSGNIWIAQANNTSSTPATNNPNWRRVALEQLIQAINVVYSNSVSGLVAANVQAAIDELKTLIDAIEPQILDFSTQAENQNGTIGNKVVSPLGIRQALRATGNSPVYAARAWALINGSSGASQTLVDGGNISSVTRVATGTYDVVWASAMQTSTYIVQGTAESDQDHVVVPLNNSKTVNGIRILTADPGQRNNDPADTARFSIVVFGN